MPFQNASRSPKASEFRPLRVLIESGKKTIKRASQVPEGFTYSEEEILARKRTRRQPTSGQDGRRPQPPQRQSAQLGHLAPQPPGRVRAHPEDWLRHLRRCLQGEFSEYLGRHTLASSTGRQLAASPFNPLANWSSPHTHLYICLPPHAPRSLQLPQFPSEWKGEYEKCAGVALGRSAGGVA